MKKNPSRFTIKFNTANSRHIKAVEMLNAAERCKASLIADALHMYASTDSRTAAAAEKQRQGSIPLQKEDTEAIHHFPDNPAMISKNTTQPGESDMWQAISDSVDAFF